jgi:hypothetical protein
MIRFKELSKSEKKKALECATDEAMKSVALGKININCKLISNGNQTNELYELLEPIAHSIAEEAFYPDEQDIIINLR